MVKVKSQFHQLTQGQDRDVNLKIFNKQIHFKNTYHLVSLGNDILTGIFFVIGSLSLLLQFPQLISNALYFVGSFFMLMRPIISMTRGVFVYDRSNKVADKFADDNLEDFLIGDADMVDIGGLTGNEIAFFEYVTVEEEESIPEFVFLKSQSDDNIEDEYVGY